MQDGDHYVHFEITGALALAGFHLMRHWVNPNTAPELETSTGPLKLKVDKRGRGLLELRQTVERIRSSALDLVESADAWLVEIDRHIARDGAG
jgi:hypothetical protein